MRNRVARAFTCAFLAGCLTFAAAPCPALGATGQPKPTKRQLISYLKKCPSSAEVKTFNSSYSLSKTGAGKRLVRYVRQLCKKYKVSIVMIDVGTGAGLSCSPFRKMYSASTLKGPYVAAVNKYRSGKVNASAKQLMREAVTVSDNDAYLSLRKRYGSGIMKSFHAYSGIGEPGYATEYRRLTTSALARLWVGTYWYFYRDTNKNSKWCRRLYTHGTQSFIYHAMKSKAGVRTKPGWHPEKLKRSQNDAGIVLAKVGGKSRPYILAVMTSAYGQHAKLRKLVRYIDAVHTGMVKAGK